MRHIVLKPVLLHATDILEISVISKWSGNYRSMQMALNTDINYIVLCLIDRTN